MGCGHSKAMRRYNHLLGEIDGVYHEMSLKLGLSDSAMIVLYTICDSGSSCLLRDICRYSGLSKQTVNSALRKLEDGSPIAPARAAALLREPGRWVLSVTIRQGLNRQVRRMCAMAGLRVHRLERVREGPLTLGDLPPGCWRPLTAAEVSALSAQP